MTLLEKLLEIQKEDKIKRRINKKMNYPKYQCKKCKTKYWYAVKTCPNCESKDLVRL
jgi:rRNA maturation endonuclease Nob1